MHVDKKPENNANKVDIAVYGQGEEDMATHRRNGLRYRLDIRQAEDQARQLQDG